MFEIKKAHAIQELVTSVLQFFKLFKDLHGVFKLMLYFMLDLSDKFTLFWTDSRSEQSQIRVLNMSRHLVYGKGTHLKLI